MTKHAEAQGEFSASYWFCDECDQALGFDVLKDFTPGIINWLQRKIMEMHADTHETATGHKTMCIEQKVAS